MTKEEVLELFSADEFTERIEGDNTLEGLNILSKYTKQDVIAAAEHDIIYSADVDDVLEAGITDDELKRLRALGFMIEESSYFATFV